MTDLDRFVGALLQWYDTRCRLFVAERGPERVTALDDAFQRLRRAHFERARELPICFLGNAGIGKSTLLNGLVAGALSVLPQGGVGPLTAQATVVRHAAEPFFRATYQSARRLNNLRFAIESHYEAQEKRLGRSFEETAAQASLSAEERLDVETSLPRSDGDGDRLKSYCDQARQLICGDQFADVPWTHLADGLRACLGMEPRWGATLGDEDCRRVAEVRAILGRGADGGGYAADDLWAFIADLQRHASGYLAPLIKTLEVGWDADFLRGGLALVDLPGVGVANDEHRLVTHRWIRNARAIALVVGRAGVTDAAADLLRTTGFLNSLLHEAGEDDPELPVLMVIGVKLDTVATDARRDERQRNPGQKPRPWVAHFDEVCARFVALIRGQLHEQLQQSLVTGAVETRGDREEAVRRVLETMEIYPVSSVDLRRLLLEDEEEPPRIATAEQSRIPGLRRALHEVVVRREQRGARRKLRLAQAAHARATAAIDVVLAQWEQEARQADDVSRLESELDAFIAPLRQEFSHRQGAFREYLRATVPVEISAQVEVATASARQAIQSYARTLEKYHWQTLRAAVRRGGCFDGAKNVDLPNELTLRFEEPIALAWSKRVLASVRGRTREMGEAYVALVGDVLRWLRSHQAQVQPNLVEALHADLEAQSENLGRVGDDALAEVKEIVKTELYEEIEQHVRVKCQEFVKAQLDRGAGVQERMHGFFRDDLPAAIVEVVRPVAQRVLTSRYSEVERQIEAALKEYRNPLDTARDAVAGACRQYARDTDLTEQRRVLSEGRAVREAAPELAPAQTPAVRVEVGS